MRDTDHTDKRSPAVVAGRTRFSDWRRSEAGQPRSAPRARVWWCDGGGNPRQSHPAGPRVREILGFPGVRGRPQESPPLARRPEFHASEPRSTAPTCLYTASSSSQVLPEQERRRWPVAWRTPPPASSLELGSFSTSKLIRTLDERGAREESKSGNGAPRLHRRGISRDASACRIARRG